MTIQKWDPIREFERMHDDLDKLFRWSGRRGVEATGEAPCCFSVDVLENADEVVLKAELPGVKPGDVSIRVEDNVLTIEGEKKFEDTENKDNYLRVERSYGAFSRSFSLPPYVDADKIKAESRDGVLTLHLPKKPETKPREIEVKVG